MQQKNFIEIRNTKIAQKTLNSLNKRFFDAYITQTKEEACQKALEFIDGSDVVSWGGSVSVVQSGLIDYLLNNNFSVINRDSAATFEERTELLRKSLLCDTYLMGTNAISDDGQLVNVDSMGNRAAALMFGPKKVIIIASVDKIMTGLDEAIKRARFFAAPVNMQRISEIRPCQTPCINTGTCSDCISKDSICSNIVVTRLCNPPKRIKVILTLEKIGF